MHNIYSFFTKVFVIFFSLLIIFFFFSKNSLFTYEIISTLKLWLNKSVPSLITMYVISSALISTKAINIIIFILKPLRKILKFETKNAFNLFIVSIFVGNPSTVTYITEYLSKEYITSKDAEVLLLSSSFINPLFIYAISKNINTFFFIYLIHIITNIIIAIFFTRKNIIINKENETNVNFLELINKLPFLLLLIALYMVISSMLIFALNSLGISKIYLSFIELSNGCNILINSFSQISYLLLVLLISFNGFCIHMQVATILNNQKMYKTFFYGRFLSMIITFIIYFFAIFFLKYT